MSIDASRSTDRLGHLLLAERLEHIPAVIEAMIGRGPAPLKPATLQAARFVVTGTGSSEAHARYLTMLLNLYTELAATYVPLSGFTIAQRDAFLGKTLIVFSQGVSPNAQIALNRRSDFSHTVLFTATPPAAARLAGKEDRARLLEGLLDAGGELIEFPLA
ncbi:MAG TPA: creatininase, partial [Opitutaceae bacterium]|nr:creatininase [Opitutaceae bacterium]